MVELSHVENCQTRIELYVRSLSPTGAHSRQEQIIDRLERLDETDRIDGFSVIVWGDQIPENRRTPVGGYVLDRLDDFRTWSDRTGASLSSFFETRESGSMLADDSRTTIVLPMFCLAEYHGDDLQSVAPRVDGGTVCTVLDRLDALVGDLDGNRR